MDNFITGVFGVGLFVAFIGGLAQSIGAAPFIIIVVAITAMAAYDFFENVREGRRSAAQRKLNSSRAP